MLIDDPNFVAIIQWKMKENMKLCFAQRDGCSAAAAWLRAIDTYGSLIARPYFSITLNTETQIE